jgi:transaldolase
MDFFPLDSEEYLAGQPEPGLRLFLDSAHPDDWKRFLPLGMFHGLTTNPLLLERAGQACSLANLERLTRLAVDLGAGEIHLQTWGPTIEEMVHNGGQLALMAGIGIDVAVKVPATESGFKVARQLSESGCGVTLTAVYNPGQVLLAAGFGAAYAAPYLGRINDQGRDGRQAVLAMRDILYHTGSETRLLVASLRSADEVVALAQAGLDTLTFGAPVAADLLKENLTDAAAEDFQRAADAMG